MASAALFTELWRTLRAGTPSKVRYRSCGYGPGMTMIPEAWLDGDENAILDFRYTPSPRLGWYFDHHITGFGSPEERDQALALTPAAASPDDLAAPPQVHFDPTYGSCTKLIADVARERLGVDLSRLADLIAWADRIDSARFPSAAAATDRTEPVLQLAAVVEHTGDASFLQTVVPKLLERPLGEVAADAEIQKLWRPIASAQEGFAARVAKNAKVEGRAVLVDLSGARLDAGAKFVTYAMFPGCAYSVTLSRNKHHYKLSVGYNPWSGIPRTHDIAAICQRYSGGGHPAVGAASFPLSEKERALTAARAVTAELAG
jgi:hypothetical protein